MQTPPTHLHHWFIIIVRLRVIPSAFAWVIASSGTWGSLWMRISCYSWWLPLPRRLGVAEEHWHELVIVHGHLPVICEGSCTFPGGESKGNSSGLLVSLSYLTLGRFLRRLVKARRGANWLSNHQVLVNTTGTSVPASTWTSGEKLVVSCPLVFSRWLI